MFFKRIGELRIDRDKKKKEMAKRLYCSRQSYTRYENGLREIPVSMLIELAKYYQVSVDYILELTDDLHLYK